MYPITTPLLEIQQKTMQIYKHNTAIIEGEVGAGTKVWAFAHICEGAVIGDNCMIGEGAHIGKNVRIGSGTRIQNRAQIFEGAVIGNNVFIAPGVIVTNDKYPDMTKPFYPALTVIEDGAHIGAGAIIIAGVRIGQGAFIGAGSVVTKNVKQGQKVYGNPAR